MPMCVVNTNVKEADIPAGYLAGLHSSFQKAIGKPDQYILVQLNPGQLMTFGGTPEPCAIVKVQSIGNIGLQENQTITQAVTAELAKISVKADRMYVVFRDVAPQDVGTSNTTVAIAYQAQAAAAAAAKGN